MAQANLTQDPGSQMYAVFSLVLFGDLSHREVGIT